MDALQGKHFSITDQKNMSTVIYQINTTVESEIGMPNFTVDRLDYSEEFRGELKKKTFFVDNPTEEGNQLIILSFGKDKIIVNMGLLQGDKVKISKKSVPIKFNTIYSDDNEEYKIFNYTKNEKRQITIIDPETTEEIKPVFYYDKDANELKGKCKLKPNKPYFAFEVREEK